MMMSLTPTVMTVAVMGATDKKEAGGGGGGGEASSSDRRDGEGVESRTAGFRE